MSAPSPCMIANLPEELLLLVFRCLCEVGPAWETEGQPERNPWLVKQLPFRHMDKETQPHAGLRGELAHLPPGFASRPGTPASARGNSVACSHALRSARDGEVA